MRNFYVVVFSVFLFHSRPLVAQIHAPDTSATEQEILSYQDSDAEIISKARRMLYTELEAKQYNKVKELLYYLSTKYKDGSYTPLWPAEQALLHLWVGNYADYFAALRLWDVAPDEKDSKIPPPHDPLASRLVSLTAQHDLALQYQVTHATLPETDQQFILLWVQYMLSQSDANYLPQAALNEKADQYLAAFPDSPHQGFVRRHIRVVMQLSKWGFGLDFFSGAGFLTGGLHRHFTNGSTIGVGFDVSYRKYVLFLRDYIGLFHSVREPFEHKGSWPAATRTNVIIAEASVGYVAAQSNRWRLIPFAGVSASGITPTARELKKLGIDKQELGLGFTYSLGVNLDWVFARQVEYSMGLYSQNNWMVRTRLTFNQPTVGQREGRFNGSIITLQVGIGGFGHFIRRQ